MVMAPEPTREKVAPAQPNHSPRKVGMYDRPATANRQPMLMIIIAVLAIVAVLISLYFFNFF